MALTPSTMLQLGTPAPEFNLPDTEGRIISLNSYPKSKGYLVMFICNHCPYVVHLKTHLAKMTAEYIKKGIAIFGINSNDFTSYPEDRPHKMKEDKETYRYQFPYLIDESQEIARAYQAACTPDFFIFDSHKKLVYRGQYDSSRPGNNEPITGKDLELALQALLAGNISSAEQLPSLGCNIKWKK
ncbi:MAG: thioredoxin family protein [Bdellovibrionales bacterium]|nr:thioredoxin family protein [Bdellovibrionales bacterium]